MPAQWTILLRLLFSALLLTDTAVFAQSAAQVHLAGIKSNVGSYYAFGADSARDQAQTHGALGDLNALSSTEFTTLGHTQFPKHGVRIKKSKFCDGTVE